MPCGRPFCEGLVHPRSANLAKKDAKSKNSVQARQFKAPAPKIVPTQSSHSPSVPSRGVHGSSPRFCGWKPLSVRWQMPTPWRKIWNGFHNERELKQWFLPSRNRLSPRRDSSSGNGSIGTRRAVFLRVEDAGNVSVCSSRHRHKTELVRLRMTTLEWQN